MYTKESPFYGDSYLREKTNEYEKLCGTSKFLEDVTTLAR